MTPLEAFVIAEAIPTIAGSGVAIAATAWLMRGQETRIQHLEHEIADLRASFNVPGTTPEVIKRYDAIQAEGQAA